VTRRSERLRNIPPDFDRRCLADIDGRLRSIEVEHQIGIGLAIESGSRAWGFPSPDSDFDCRFVFARRIEDYLSPWQKRDVIETPLVGDLDLNGWDLAKALRLLLKGNAVVVEWLTSPIVYDGDSKFREELRALASRHGDAAGTARHYLHLGEGQRKTYFAPGKPVALKKLFYALRPAAALRWLRLHSGEAVAPMHFPTLMLECEPPAEVARIAADLIARKAETRELGMGELPGEIERFVESEFALARETVPPRAGHLSREGQAEAAAFFRHWVERLANSPSSPAHRKVDSEHNAHS
jgi:uncharacterized protein